MSVWRKLMCRIGNHRRLDVIQTFGSAQHIGCPDCKKQYGIHHGMLAVVSWNSEFDDLYQRMGFDTEQATKRWYAALAGEKKDG